MVCVWDKHSCCRGLYKCKEAVSVCFIRRTTDEGQVENPLHCECVCVERAQKEETKIERGGRMGSAKAQTLPLLSSFSSLYLPVSLSLSRSLVLGLSK